MNSFINKLIKQKKIIITKPSEYVSKAYVDSNATKKDTEKLIDIVQNFNSKIIEKIKETEIDFIINNFKKTHSIN